MSRKNIKFIIPVFVLCMSLFLCAFGTAVELDVAKNGVYRNITAAELGRKYNADSASALRDYKLSAVTGRITSITSDGKKFTVSSGNNDTFFVSCESKKGYSFSVNDNVKVYGTVSKKIFSKDMAFTVDYAEPFTGEISGNYSWSLINGRTIDKSEVKTVSLGDGRVSYRVPSKWTAVQEKLPNADGYAYVLSDLPGERSGTEELFFAFYFDNKGLNINDRVKYDDTLDPVWEFFKNQSDKIEKGIIQNILGDEPAGSMKNRISPQGVSYDYYDATYSKDIIGKAYNVEFVFKTVGNYEGFMVYVYVYTNDSMQQEHVDEILLSLRLAEENW